MIVEDRRFRNAVKKLKRRGAHRFSHELALGSMSPRTFVDAVKLPNLGGARDIQSD
jgi:hypothetical protein